jgi:hypothetical protein
MSTLRAAAPAFVPGKPWPGIFSYHVKFTIVSLAGETLLTLSLPSSKRTGDLRIAIEEALPEKGPVLHFVFKDSILEEKDVFEDAGMSPECTVQAIFGNLGLRLNLHHEVMGLNLHNEVMGDFFIDRIDHIDIHIAVAEGDSDSFWQSWHELQNACNLREFCESEFCDDIDDCDGLYLLYCLRERVQEPSTGKLGPSYHEVLEKDDPEGLARLEQLLGTCTKASFFRYSCDIQVEADTVCDGVEALVDEQICIRLMHLREDCVCLGGCVRNR